MALLPIMATRISGRIAVNLLAVPAESVTDSLCWSEVIERVVNFQTYVRGENLECI